MFSLPADHIWLALSQSQCVSPAPNYQKALPCHSNALALQCFPLPEYRSEWDNGYMELQKSQWLGPQQTPGNKELALDPALALRDDICSRNFIITAFATLLQVWDWRYRCETSTWKALEAHPYVSSHVGVPNSKGNCIFLLCCSQS